MTQVETYSPIKSKKVRGYVKATLRWRKLRSRLDAAEAKLTSLRRKVTEADAECKTRREKLTGTQLAAADRLLAQPIDVLEALAKPCKAVRT